MSDATFSNSGTFDGLDATLQVIAPDCVAGEFQASVQLSQSGIQPVINFAFAIDTSGSTASSTGIDLTGDGVNDTFLQAQIFAAEQLLTSLVNAGYTDSVQVTIVNYGDSNADSFTAPLSDADQLRAYVNSLTSDGNTPFNLALAEIQQAWTLEGVDPNDTNIVYFFSDGRPQPLGQDFVTPLNSLEASFSPLIRGVGFGINSSEAALNVIDNSGNGAAILLTEQDLQDLLVQPPPLPEVDSFDIIVDGVVIETIDADDPRVLSGPTGLTISNLDISGYPFTPGAADTLQIEVRTNFTNGETLTAGGPLELRDGTVEGTAGDDIIDLAYMGDPTCDMIDAADNIDPSAVGSALNDDIVVAGDGNDFIDAGDGVDTVFGGTGNDTIVMNSGGVDDGFADVGFGGDDRDTFTNVGANDSVVGGEGGDDFDTLDLSGAGPLRINFTNDDPTTESGTVVFYDGNGFGPGNITGQMTFSEIEQVIPCFTPGTLIATPRGEVPVESLKPGDRIVTRDNGLQEIRWTGRKVFAARDMAAVPHLRPVMIKAGSLGAGLPERDMLVSPNHRVLMTGEATQLYFDETEVLVAAKHLVGKPGIHRVDVMSTTYIHFMFDRHEVVLSDGSWTESFQPGDWSLKGIDADQRGELLTLFPELASTEGREGFAAARVSLKKHEARLLID